MIKKMISFTRPQLEWLEAEAERLGISMAELSRRLIDQARHDEWRKQDTDATGVSREKQLVK